MKAQLATNDMKQAYYVKKFSAAHLAVHLAYVNFTLFLGRHSLGGGGQISDPFYKFGSLSNMCQNLVTIDRVTAEIRR